MLVFLIGFMGCGKSTLGKKIANKLNWQYIDLDIYIEKTKNRTIDEIFRNEGKIKFRTYEHEVLLEIIKSEDNFIISTGGGTPCYHDNMQIMNDNGITIYLKSGFGLLFYRLRNSKKQRPLIVNKTDPELQSFILKTLAKREKYYKRSKYTFEIKTIQLSAVINAIESDINYPG